MSLTCRIGNMPNNEEVQRDRHDPPDPEFCRPTQPYGVDAQEWRRVQESCQSLEEQLVSDDERLADAAGMLLFACEAAEECLTNDGDRDAALHILAEAISIAKGTQ
jgi:hypothetical protein